MTRYGILQFLYSWEALTIGINITGSIVHTFKSIKYIYIYIHWMKSKKQYEKCIFIFLLKIKTVNTKVYLV